MSGQSNLGAVDGGAWRAALSEPIRRQHLASLVAPVLQGLNEQQSATVMNHAFHLENQVYSTAKTSHEYVELVKSKILELSHKVKSLIPNQLSAASAGPSVAAQGSGAVNPAAAAALLQSAQFNQQNNAQPQPQAQPQLQAHGQAQPQAQVTAQGAPVGAQPTAESIIPHIRNIMQNPDNYSIQDLSVAINFLQSQAGSVPDKQVYTEAMGKLFLAARKKQQQQQQQQQQQPQSHQQQSQANQLQIQAALRQQQQQQQLAALHNSQAGANSNAGNMVQSLQLQQQQQQQLLQMRLQGQQNLPQHQNVQDNPQLVNAAQLTGGFSRAVGAGTAASGSVGPGQGFTDDTQRWLHILRTFTRPFKFNEVQVDLTFMHGYKMFMQFKERGDTVREASVGKFLQDLIITIQAEVGRGVDKDALQLAVQEVQASMGGGAAAQATNQPTPNQLPSHLPGAQATPTMGNATALDSRVGGSNMQAAMQGAFSGSAMTSIPTNVSAQSTPTNVVVSTGAAAATAAPAAGKKQGTGKQPSSSVAGSKSKKKSQSPRTSTKARKESPKAPAALQVQPDPSAIGGSAPGNTATSVVATASTSASQAAAAATANAPPMNRSESISTETATKVVAEIAASIDHSEIKRFPRISISDQDKKLVKDHLSFIEPLLGPLSKLLPVIFMCLKSAEQIKSICSIELIVKEQLRLLKEEQYIVSPANTLNYYELIRNFMGVAKNWGNMHQQDLSHTQAAARASAAAATGQPNAMVQQTGGAAGGGNAKAGAVQETPLTNLHPGAMTNDPALENFQKAVKHPLDAVSLKLPAAKKRASNKSSAAGGAQAIAATGVGGQLTQQQQQQRKQQQLQQLQNYAQSHTPASAPFAPAPPVLPPGIGMEDFEKLSLEQRTAILKNQQAVLIRQHSIGVNTSPSGIAQQQQQMQGWGAPQNNPLLVSAILGTEAPGVSAQSAEEQRLKILEQDKWNRPLEYLMCVLGKFSKGAEKAGVDPSPVLQQAFWPIARKSMMSSGWGVVAPDAVL